MSIATYLNSLDNDRDTLAANLTTMGIQASSSETFTTLVPKVLNIPTGGDEWNSNAEYNIRINTTNAATNENFANFATGLKKITVKDVTLYGTGENTVGLPYLEDLIFEDCQLGTSSSGDGIKITNSYSSLKTVTFKNCSLSASNSTASAGGGIYISSSSASANLDTVVFNGLTIPAGRTKQALTIRGASIKNITGLNTINISASDITDFNNMFGSLGVTSLDLSSWVVTPTKINSMFADCRSLTMIDISGFDCTNITTTSDYRYMFNSVPTTCTIYVKDAANQAWFSSKFPTYTFTVKS